MTEWKRRDQPWLIHGPIQDLLTGRLMIPNSVAALLTLNNEYFQNDAVVTPYK